MNALMPLHWLLPGRYSWNLDLYSKDLILMSYWLLPGRPYRYSWDLVLDLGKKHKDIQRQSAGTLLLPVETSGILSLGGDQSPQTAWLWSSRALDQAWTSPRVPDWTSPKVPNWTSPRLPDWTSPRVPGPAPFPDSRALAQA
ncbi:unnamed protein product [Arctogadus glacialis]